MEMMCSRDFDGGRDYFVFAQQFDEVDLPDDACHILVIDGVPSVGRIIDQVGAYQQPITCFSSYNFDMQSLGYVDVYVMRRFFDARNPLVQSQYSYIDFLRRLV